jgi:hypothetical protein
MLHFLKYIVLLFVDALPDISNILLAILGVLMSFPEKAQEIERSPVWRKAIAYSCIAVGVAGFAASIYQRRQFSSDIRHLVNDDAKLVANTGSLVSSTSTMVTGFGILMPRLAALESHVSDLDVKIASAREKHDPRLVADLQAQVIATRKEAAKLSETMLLSLAPGVVSEMQYWAHKWPEDDASLTDEIQRVLSAHPSASPEESRLLIEPIQRRRSYLSAENTMQIQPLLTNANYIREALLRNSEKTQEDKAVDAIFAKALAGQSINWVEMISIADYMQELVRRGGAPQH